MGTGPFIITNYVKNQFVQLDRNPNYWGNDVGLTPHVDQIIYRIYGNQDAEAAALQSGEVDFGYFTSGQHPEHAEVPRPRDARRSGPELR